MTIKELKKILENWPEQDKNGEDFQVWLGNKQDCYTNEAVEYKVLNKHDLLLISNH